MQWLLDPREKSSRTSAKIFTARSDQITTPENLHWFVPSDSSETTAEDQELGT